MDLFLNSGEFKTLFKDEIPLQKITLTPGFQKGKKNNTPISVGILRKLLTLS